MNDVGTKAWVQGQTCSSERSRFHRAWESSHDLEPRGGGAKAAF